MAARAQGFMSFILKSFDILCDAYAKKQNDFELNQQSVSKQLKKLGHCKIYEIHTIRLNAVQSFDKLSYIISSLVCDAHKRG